MQHSSVNEWANGQCVDEKKNAEIMRKPLKKWKGVKTEVGKLARKIGLPMPHNAPLLSTLQPSKMQAPMKKRKKS